MIRPLGGDGGGEGVAGIEDGGRREDQDFFFYGAHERVIVAGREAVVSVSSLENGIAGYRIALFFVIENAGIVRMTFCVYYAEAEFSALRLQNISVLEISVRLKSDRRAEVRGEVIFRVRQKSFSILVYIHGDFFIFSELFYTAYVVEMAVCNYQLFYDISLFIYYIGYAFPLSAAVEKKAVSRPFVNAEKSVCVVTVIICNNSFYHFIPS